MALLLRVLLPDQNTFRKCKGCKDDSKSIKNVTLGMLFWELWLKEAEKKATGRNRETPAFYCDRNSLFKHFTPKVFEITTKSSPASLTVTVYGAAYLPSRYLLQREEFHATPPSSLPDYFWS